MVAPCGEVQNMNDWQSTWLGRRCLPRDLSDFEIEAFFTFSGNERRVIEERRGPALKIALALQIGFLRMTGRLLEAVRMVPPALWRHLGKQFDVAAPDLASLRAMYIGAAGYCLSIRKWPARRSAFTGSQSHSAVL
jgi:hypothetical protein